MNSMFRDRGVQAGLALSAGLLAAALLGYCVLFAFATRQVLQLDLRHVAPLAGALEQNLSKDVILLHYANSIYVGNTKDSLGRTMNMDGVKTAAYHLFGKDDLRSLSLAEAATIVALFTAPNSLMGAATSGNPQPLLRARNIVLRKAAEVNPAKYQKIADRAGSEMLSLRTVDG